MFQDPESTCFVGNISPNASPDIIEELFSQIGPVVRVSMKEGSGKGEDDVSRSHTQRVATSRVLVKLESTLPSAKYDHEATAGSSDKKSTSNKLVLQDLRQVFEPFGAVLAFNVGERMGHVVYSSSSEAEKASESLDGMHIGRNQLHVQLDPVNDRSRFEKPIYAFVEFSTPHYVPLAIRAMNGIRLFNRDLRVELSQNAKGAFDEMVEVEVANLHQSLSLENIRDIFEWGTRAWVYEMIWASLPTHSHGGLRTAKLYFANRKHASRAVLVFNGKHVKGFPLCVTMQSDSPCMISLAKE